MKSCSCFFSCNFCTCFQDIKYICSTLLPHFSSLTDWSKLRLHYIIQEFLNFYIAKTTSLIVSLQFIKILILWQELLKMLRPAESIQINKYRISFHASWILNPKMIRICKHGHDLLLNHIFFIRKINTVSERLAHFCFSIDTRKT